MDKNEFDIDFDFEKEFGLTPEDLNDPELDGDLDLSQFDLDLSEDQDGKDADDLSDIENFLKNGLEDDEEFSDDLFADEELTEEVDEEAEEVDPADAEDGDVNLDDTRLFFDFRELEKAEEAEAEVSEEAEEAEEEEIGQDDEDEDDDDAF